MVGLANNRWWQGSKDCATPQGERTYADAHAVGTQIPYAQDALPVSDHRYPHILFRPVGHHAAHVAL